MRALALEEELPPDPRLMESLRSVGYTLKAALADLVDNSLSAMATEVDIDFGTDPEDYLGVRDDGSGMSRAEARNAMQLAGVSPLTDRRADDLGRFGLGLKTASLSQCRELTIVSIGSDGLIGYRWDLDYLATAGRWVVQALDVDEMRALPHVADLLGQSQGTIVLWRKLDALRNQVGGDEGWNAAMVDARDHLQLVFHRFISGEHGRPFTMRINGNQLEAIDPFLRTHRATSKLPSEAFDVEGSTVTVQPYTLPHISRMKSKDLRQAEIAGKFRDSQGFYVYRAMRLVIWGTWFRVRPREDLAKLARVQVDIPNTLDHLWALDIKKSAAQPPPEVRERLRRIAGKLTAPSKRTFTFRGRQVHDDVTRIWALVENDGAFRYEINRDHPLLLALSTNLDPEKIADLERLLKLAEQAYPADDLFSRLSGDAKREDAQASDEERVDLARRYWQLMKKTGLSPEGFVAAAKNFEPFDGMPGADKILYLGATEE